MTLTDYMYLKRRKEEDLLALKTVLTDQYKDAEKHEGILISATRNDTNNMTKNRMKITRKQLCEEKQPGRCFKWLISNISHEKTWTWLSKENLKRETESLQRAAQNNAISTDQIKVRIDETQQNSKCDYVMIET